MPRLARTSTLALTALILSCAAMSLPAAEPLRSLPPERILEKLDLSGPGLEKVQAAAEKGDREAALAALLEYYRGKFPLPEKESVRADLAKADAIVGHTFQWGPYEAFDYGPEIDWSADPRGDIEWVAVMYRFFWAPPLADAFAATRDDKYVAAFVELAEDWIRKHPLEKRDVVHPVYRNWRGYPWLDIQTGVRASAICRSFPALVHGKSFTPRFLGVFLASLYDHQQKTLREPMNQIHNKAIFEQRGFVKVAAMFSEFRDSKEWMKTALEISRKNFLDQTTSDGVQREWSWGYNCAVLDDAVEIMRKAEAFGLEVPADYKDRIHACYDYIFAMSGPDLTGPMFGDASRPPIDMKKMPRHDWAMYTMLREATELLGDPKYLARGQARVDALPKQTDYAFPLAGMYVMRSGWGPGQIMMTVHCSPMGVSGHDQKDNGTFELAAFGRWLMPDTGFYTYGHDPKARAWHRQTAVHQTLTLAGKDTQYAGEHVLWKTTPEWTVLVVKNQSYKNVVHRRTIWFVDRRFFVLLDEAIGEAKGDVALHYQLAAGKVEADPKTCAVHTCFDDANVLIQVASPKKVEMAEEEGWHAWKYGKRERRPAFGFKAEDAPVVFLTVVCPYEGKTVPKVEAELPEGFRAGDSGVKCRVSVEGEVWEVGRDVDGGEAGVRRIDGQREGDGKE